MDNDNPDSNLIIDWYDTSLLADIWFARKVVTPEEAAILLCGINPNSTDAKANAKNHLEHSYIDLLTLFQGRTYNLLGYVEVAKQRGISYHSWADEYLKAKEVLMGNLEISQLSPPPRPPKAPFNHAEMIRLAARDLDINLNDMPQFKIGRPSPARKALHAHLVTKRRVLTNSKFKRGWEALLKEL